MRLLQSLVRTTDLSILVLLAGCASSAGGSSVAGYATTPCADLDVAIGDTSKSISSVAISRGKIDRLNIPFWVPGGDKAVTALKDRRTRKIEKLEEQLEAMRSARRARCHEHLSFEILIPDAGQPPYPSPDKSRLALSSSSA